MVPFFAKLIKGCLWYCKKIGDKISACEVAEEWEILVGKIKNRKNLNFLTTDILSLLNGLKNNNMYDENSFKKSTDLFYNTFYLT